MQKIKTAILSFGMSGRVFHAPFIEAHPGFELVGSWERTKKNLQQHYPYAKSYSTLEELLQDAAVDLVVVNTPTFTHYDLAKNSLEAGKHVIVEKAFTTTVAEAVELKVLADSKGKMLSVFQNRRWDSDFKTIKRIIESEILGDMIEVSFSYDRYNPALSPKLHKEIPRPGSGVVYDLGPHLIDQALFLFGMPHAVFANITITRPTSEVDDFFELLLFYKTFSVRLRASYFVREPAPSYIIHGTIGSFLKARTDVQEVALQAGKKPTGPDWGIEPEQEMGLLHTMVDGKIVRERVTSLQGNYIDYYEGVYQSIVNKKPAPVTADDGIRVMQIIEAAHASRDEKRIIDIT